jgi:hypothetical protein
MSAQAQLDAILAERQSVRETASLQAQLDQMRASGRPGQRRQIDRETLRSRWYVAAELRRAGAASEHKLKIIEIIELASG